MTQQSIKFLHLRRTHARRGVMDVGSSALATGGATIAYVQDITGAIRLAYAKCSEQDLYSKSKGRQLAQERLLAWDNAKWLGVLSRKSPSVLGAVAVWALQEGLV